MKLTAMLRQWLRHEGVVRDGDQPFDTVDPVCEAFHEWPGVFPVHKAADDVTVVLQHQLEAHEVDIPDRDKILGGSGYLA